MVIEVEARRWGSSLGFVIPKKDATALGVKEGDKLTIEVSKSSNPFKEMFGAIKFSKPTEQLIKEARKELESKWMR